MGHQVQRQTSNMVHHVKDRPQIWSIRFKDIPQTWATVLKDRLQTPKSIWPHKFILKHSLTSKLNILLLMRQLVANTYTNTNTDTAVTGLFDTRTIRPLDYSAPRWTIRPLDYSAPWTIRHSDYFAPGPFIVGKK